MFSRYNLFLLVVPSAFCVWLSPEARAHRLNVFAYPQGDEIRIESYFSRGGGCKNCGVTVLDAAGKVIESGTTDEQGRWSFRPVGREAVKMAVSAGEGHRGEYALLEADFPGGATETETGDSDWTIEVADPAQSHDHSHDAPSLTAREVEGIVERVLERKLGPIRRDLSQALVPEPGMQEIIGGIGYIFGLFGVAAYFMSRSNRRS